MPGLTIGLLGSPESLNVPVLNPYQHSRDSIALEDRGCLGKTE